MPANEARLYFVVTVKGDLGPFSKGELREQLRAQSILGHDRVRNAFGRPLGTVGEVLGASSQMMQQPAHPPSRRSGASPAATARKPAPLAIVAVAVGVLVILLLLWAMSGGAPAQLPPAQPQTQPQTQPTTTSAPQTQRPATPAPAPATNTATATPATPIAPQPAPTPPPASTGQDGVPAGFAYLDLGDARPKGSVAANAAGLIVLNGGGADIWGERDECAFLHRRLDGDAVLTVQLRSMDNTDGWDKAGLMLRASTDPASAHVSIIAIHSGLVQLLTRQGIGRSTGATHLQLDGFPIWLRLQRQGGDITGYVSRNGSEWRLLGTSSIDGLPASATAGLAVTSHNRSITNRALFSDLAIEPAPR